MRFHKLFAVLAVAGFAGHLVASLFMDVAYWLPEYIWFASVIFAVLSIYAGGITATKGAPADKGAALASAVIGAVILLSLTYSSITWLFVLDDISAIPAGAGL